ncbi:hypothetical protein EPUS_09316 [Endocarpon pusillum Z07020]|uniref:Mitochondrial outer membrane protein n=1 Tax=Endocarpon pusillum (strain Z07020 / HMAS-L-300199) TaxID=1263415 RepID=U1GXC6_ENDPU|nr:uncharacterized protein EPUS_09316 [Endocarpon pusillum Z07020]ERF77143.1 hypothetical protein EPUS_09316 [Endocarpon pusillum Z07020]
MPEENEELRKNEIRAVGGRRPVYDLFQLPSPVKRIFDKFPLKTYPANDLPRRSPPIGHFDTLHIFTTQEGALQHAPSFNPACLKWQAYLRFSEIEFKTISSNNHASPTGVLPFLTPKSSSPSASSSQPISSNKILKWVSSRSDIVPERVSGMRYEAYRSLIDHRIRSAWLFTLYLDERNSEVVAKQLYIYPISSNALVQLSLYYQLKQAARDELLKTASYIREDEVYLEAENAFAAISTLLGDDVYFFGNDRPTLFDANIFAYTHLLLDESLNWQETRLADSLKKRENLVQHRQRILTGYFDRHNAL